MEERQKQITEGAGLDEARLNTEFIDFLKKFGPYLMMAVALAAGIYAYINFRARTIDEGTDHAFAELNSALEARNPTNLVKVADEYESRGAVALLARLSAADAHLSASRTGVPAGVTLGQDGKLPEGVNLLTAEERTAELTKAYDLYTSVSKSANRTAGQSILAIGALNGLASVSESRGELDKAKAYYQQVIDKAKTAKFDGLATAATERLKNLDALAAAPKLLASADLPGGNVPKSTLPMTNVQGVTSGGQAITINPDGTVQNAPPGLKLERLPGPPPGMNPDAPAGTPQPAPQPAPAPAPNP